VEGLFKPDELTADLPIGGKADGLWKLHQLGAPVPAWSVIPADIAGQLAVQGGLYAELQALFSELDLGSGMAVRSSGLGEDQRDRSNAGAFDTVFCTTFDEIPDAIHRVARSGPGDGGVAVVLQSRVHATQSGVLFSAHPSHARPDRAYLEVVAGPPNGLVDGTAEPTRLYLNPETGVVIEGAEAESDRIPEGLPRTLCDWMRASERAFACAVDIEWAVDDDRLWLLQARPITRLYLDPELCPEEEATSWFFDQRFNEPLRPITRSALLPLVVRAGVEDALAMRNKKPPAPLVYDFAGLPYVALKAYHQILAGIPSSWLTADLKQLYPDGLPRPKWFPGLRLLRDTGRILWRTRREALFNLRAWRAFKERLSECLEAIPDEDGTDPEAWNDAWASLDELTVSFLRIHRWSIVLADAVYAVWRKSKAFLPGGMRAAREDRLRGEIHQITAEANRAKVQALDGGHPDGVYVQDFGHRSPSLDFATPTWGESDAGLSLPALPSPQAIEGRPSARGLLPRLLEMREEQRFVWEMILARQRRQLLRAGETLVGRGLLDESDTIMWFTWSELGDALHRDVAPGTKALDCRKRAHYVFLPACRPLHIGPDRAVDKIGKSGREGSQFFQGLGASSGTARGRARVLPRGIRHDTVITKGEILVMPNLDPSCTGIMAHASGLVIERGGLLSHAAIVAREYGIPLVIGVEGIVDLQKAGDVLEIDGTRGTVRVGPAEPPSPGS
jgi:rifampicin phosphotransferase